MVHRSGSEVRLFGEEEEVLGEYAPNLFDLLVIAKLIEHTLLCEW